MHCRVAPLILVFYTILPSSVQAARCRSLLTKPLVIALAQINTRIGDLAANSTHILRFIEQAGAVGADTVVFPELSISGYPPRDLLDLPEFSQESEVALHSIASTIRAMGPAAPRTVILGAPLPNSSATGRLNINAAVVIHDGEIVHIQAKRLLPHSDVFDDERYFEPGVTSQLWDSGAGKVGCVVCEDSWARELVYGRLRYHSTDPAQDLVDSDIIVNLSASPFEARKDEIRRRVFSGFAQRAEAPVVFVNQVGAHDDILFDGRSRIYGSDGQILLTLPAFEEALVVARLIATDAGERAEVLSTWSPSGIAVALDEELSEIESIHRGLVTGIRDYFSKTNYVKAAIGLSGGIDSSVVATLLVEALGAENVVGVLMPSGVSSDHSVIDAVQLASNLGILTVTVPIEAASQVLGNILAPAFADISAAGHRNVAPEKSAVEANFHARLRGNAVMAITNQFPEFLAVNTSNKSELMVGQCTIYGDMNGAIAPIGDLYKTEVYALARHLNIIRHRIPLHSIEKPANAELPNAPTDEEKFGAWPMLDRVLYLINEECLSVDQVIAQGFDEEYVRRTIQEHHRLNEFKRRQSAVIFKVSRRAIGSGRRMPVAARMTKVSR